MSTTLLALSHTWRETRWGQLAKRRNDFEPALRVGSPVGRDTCPGASLGSGSGRSTLERPGPPLPARMKHRPASMSADHASTPRSRDSRYRSYLLEHVSDKHKLDGAGRHHVEREVPVMVVLAAVQPSVRPSARPAQHRRIIPSHRVLSCPGQLAQVRPDLLHPRSSPGRDLAATGSDRRPRVGSSRSVRGSCPSRPRFRQRRRYPSGHRP